MSSTRFHVLIALVAFAPLAKAANEADSAELVTRAYSLESVLPPLLLQDFNTLMLATVPLEEGGALESFAAESGQRFTEDRVLDLLTRVVATDEWQLPGRAISIDRAIEPILLVTAPQQTQTEIQRCLEFLATHFRRSLRVRAEIYSIANGTNLGAVPDGDARAWITGLMNAGALASSNDVTLGLTSGSPRLWSRTRTRSTVRHFETEIAQRASSAWPNLDVFETGDRLLVRADCGIGNQVTVRFVAHHVDDARPMRKIDCIFNSSVATNDRILENNRELTIESPQLEFSTLGGSFALVPNQTRVAFVTPSGSDELDHYGMLVALTLESVAPAEREFRSGDRTLMILDTAGSAAAGCTFPERAILRGVEDSVHADGPELRSIAAFGVATTSPIVQRIFEFVLGSIDGAAEGGDWNECINGFVFLTGENAGKFAGAVEQALAVRSDGSCRGFLDAGPKRNARLALFELPIGETPSIAFSGFAETVLSHLNTDVADASTATYSASTPLVTGRFWRIDGAARSASTDLSISCEQRLRRGDPAVLVEKTGSGTRLERVDVSHNSFAEALATGQDSATYPRAYSLLEGTGPAAVLTSGNIVIERRTGR